MCNEPQITDQKPRVLKSPAAGAPTAIAAVPAEIAVEAETDRRKANVDRRTGMDRRILTPESSDYTGPDRREASNDRRAVGADDTGLERRRGPGRRRSDDRRTAEEGEMSAEQFEFIMAVETYKKVNKRFYPTWTEILEVVSQLGYRKVAHRDIQLENVPEPDLYVGPDDDQAKAA